MFEILKDSSLAFGVSIVRRNLEANHVRRAYGVLVSSHAVSFFACPEILFRWEINVLTSSDLRFDPHLTRELLV